MSQHSRLLPFVMQSLRDRERNRGFNFLSQAGRSIAGARMPRTDDPVANIAVAIGQSLLGSALNQWGVRDDIERRQQEQSDVFNIISGQGELPTKMQALSDAGYADIANALSFQDLLMDAERQSPEYQRQIAREDASDLRAERGISLQEQNAAWQRHNAEQQRRYQEKMLSIQNEKTATDIGLRIQKEEKSAFDTASKHRVVTDTERRELLNNQLRELISKTTDKNIQTMSPKIVEIFSQVVGEALNEGDVNRVFNNFGFKFDLDQFITNFKEGGLPKTILPKLQETYQTLTDISKRNAAQFMLNERENFDSVYQRYGNAYSSDNFISKAKSFLPSGYRLIRNSSTGQIGIAEAKVR